MYREINYDSISQCVLSFCLFVPVCLFLSFFVVFLIPDPTCIYIYITHAGTPLLMYIYIWVWKKTP